MIKPVHMAARRLYLGLVLLMCALGVSAVARAQKGSIRHTAGIGDPRVLLDSITSGFLSLQKQCIRPAKGYIQHDYLVPGGFYGQMWDWDGFFIGCHLASENRDNIRYLKWWVLNFANSADSAGYISGCITTEGPRQIFGKFAMKPFLSQGAYLASKWSGDYSWITPALYRELKLAIHYRETTQYDSSYHLFFWVNAMQSGADNNVVLTNDEHDQSAILAVDINIFQLREYRSMRRIAEKLGYRSDARHFRKKEKDLKRSVMKHLWFAGDHSFFNIRRDNGKPLKRVSYSNFVPLIEGTRLLSKKEGRMMIRKYLWNENRMLAPYGLRSLSKQDTSYNNKAIIIPYSNWQGPVWIVANYLYFIGLKQYGFDREARELSVILGNLVLADIRSCGSMHEDYNGDTGAPLAPTAQQSKDGIFTGFVGWNMLVQNMLAGTVKNKWMLLQID